MNVDYIYYYSLVKQSRFFKIQNSSKSCHSDFDVILNTMAELKSHALLKFKIVTEIANECLKNLKRH